jgi:hypothetical protein
MQPDGVDMKSNLIKIGLALLLLAAAGCMWHLPLAGPAESAKYAQMQPPLGSGLIYVLRLDEVEGGGIMSLVRLDGKLFGIVKGGVYLAAVVPPGKHRISVMLDEGQELDVNVAADTSYYVSHFLRVKAGRRQARLEGLDSGTGRKLIRGYRLSKKNFYADTLPK